MENPKMVGIEEDKPLKSSVIFDGIWPTVKPLVNGGLAGFLVTSQLCGLISVTLDQLRKPSSSQFLKMVEADLRSSSKIDSIVKVLPVLRFYAVANATTRLGSFEILRKRLEAANHGRPLTVYQDACCGLTAGAIGASLSCPILLTAQKWKVDATHPWNVRNVFHRIYHNFTEEGILGLWKGGSYSLSKVTLVNTAMLVPYYRSYTYFKDSCGLGEMPSQIGAGALSGFFSTICDLPFQNFEKLVQSFPPDDKLKFRHANIGVVIDCARKLYKSGHFKPFKGFLPLFTVSTPAIMLTWVLLEAIPKIEESLGL